MNRRQGDDSGPAEFSISTEGTPPRSVVIEPPRGWIRIPWRELWEYHDLWWMLSLQQIQVRYRQAVLGGLWAFLQPVAAAAAFSLVFRGLVGDTGGVPYFLFAYSGTVLWIMVSAIVSEGATSLLKNALLLTKVYFPRLIMPLSTLGFSMLDFVVGMGVLVLAMAWFRYPLSPRLLVVPVVILGVASCALAVAILMSALTVRYRDFRFVVPFGLQLWLFLSPVIYPVKVLPNSVRQVIGLNPLVGWLSAFRGCVFGTPVNWTDVGIAVATTLVLMVGALVYFRQVEGSFSDIV